MLFIKIQNTILTTLAVFFRAHVKTENNPSILIIEKKLVDLNYLPRIPNSFLNPELAQL